MPLADNSADVIVVGAGPAGSTAATLLARAGADVLLLEKSTFPRDKVCGDGLTPRGVKQLLALGVDLSGDDWLRNRGLRVVGGGVTLELDWPELSSFPDFGVVRPRRDFDAMLAGLATNAGARMGQATTVTGPLLDDRTGRVRGVAAKTADGPAEFSAPLVVAADGVSARTAIGMGLQKNDKRPMGVAVRRYYRSEARTKDDYLESHLELWDRTDAGNPILMPGYGWIFGLGDGTVNVGLGVLNTSKAFGRTDYRALLKTWMAGVPADWQLSEDTAEGAILGAALPMGFNRTPQYKDGLVLIGDSAGLVNPFNGEGIAYAMESATLAADAVLQALGRGEGPAREAALAAYPVAVSAQLGRYYRLGNTFSKLIGQPKIMATATKLGLPRKRLMYLVLKLLAGLYDTRDGDWADRVVTALTKAVPSVR